MPVARLPPQIALSGESATTVTERSWECLWLAPGRSLLLRLFVSSILRFSEDLQGCEVELYAEERWRVETQPWSA